LLLLLKLRLRSHLLKLRLLPFRLLLLPRLKLPPPQLLLLPLLRLKLRRQQLR
jgi:hypothetical protein